MYVKCVWLSVEAGRRSRSPLNWRYRWLGAARDGCCALNLCSLEEHYVFLTAESSLQPPVVEADTPAPARVFSPNQLSQFSMKSLSVKEEQYLPDQNPCTDLCQSDRSCPAGQKCYSTAVIRPTKQTSWGMLSQGARSQRVRWPCLSDG